MRDAVRNGLEQLREVLNSDDVPQWQGVVTHITYDGNVTIQKSYPENFIKGDTFYIFPILYDDTCTTNYNSNDIPAAIARAILIDQDEHSSTLQIIGSQNLQDQKHYPVQAGDLVKFSGGNIYNRRSYYEHERVEIEDKLRLASVQNTVIRFKIPGYQQIAPLRVKNLILEATLEQAAELGLEIGNVERAL